MKKGLLACALALGMLGLPTGAAMALGAWAMTLACTSAVSGYVGMDLLAEPLGLNTELKRFAGYVAAMLALRLAMAIPYVGTIVSVASCFLGMGVLFSVAFLRARGDAGPRRGAVDAG